jgi:hypothetical protein
MLKSTTTSVEKQAGELAIAGTPTVAIDLLEGELRLQPDIGVWRRLRATLLYREGRREEAFQEAQRALALAPLNAVLACPGWRLSRRRPAPIGG